MHENLPNNEGDRIFCHIYIRVSTGKQLKDGFSMENQKNKCTDYAKDRGWEIVNYYSDGGKTGKNMERKQLKLMLSACRPGDKILVYAISRLGRNTCEMAKTYEELRAKNVTLCSVTENFANDNSAAGKFLMHMLFSIAEWELNETTNRSKVIIDNKKMCGEVVGQVGFGYKIHRWNNRRYVYPISHEQAGIYFIIECRNKDPIMSWNDIGYALSLRGWHPVRTNRYSDEKEVEEKRPWKHSTLQGLYDSNKKRYFDHTFHSLTELRKYEDYKVPLCVPYNEIEYYIDYNRGEFDYLKKFGHVYGLSAVNVPNLKQLQQDIKDGKLDNFPDKFKEDVNNAIKYGIKDNGTPKINLEGKNIKYFMTVDMKKLDKFFAIVMKRELSPKNLNDMIKKYFEVPITVMDDAGDTVYDFLTLCQGMSSSEMIREFEENF